MQLSWLLTPPRPRLPGGCAAALSVNEHRISHVIDTLIVPMDVPPCTPQTDCTDCADWTFQ